MRGQHLALTLPTRYRTKFRGFLGEAYRLLGSGGTRLQAAWSEYEEHIIAQSVLTKKDPFFR